MHPLTCTGCPDCDAEMDAALRACSAGDYKTYCAWLKKQDAKHALRAAGAHPELRTNVHHHEDTRDDFPSPDPYAAGVKRMQAAAATPESRFEDQFKAERLRALEREYEQMKEHHS